MSNECLDKISDVWHTTYDFTCFHLDTKKGFYVIVEKIPLAVNNKVKVIGLELIINDIDEPKERYNEPLIIMVEEMIVYGSTIYKIENYRLKSSNPNLKYQLGFLLGQKPKLFRIAN